MTTFQDPPPQSRRAVRQSERGETPPQPVEAAQDQAAPYSFDSVAQSPSTPQTPPADTATPQTGRRAQPSRVAPPVDAETVQPLASQPPPAVPGESAEQAAYRVRDFSPDGGRRAAPPSASFPAPARPVELDYQTQGVSPAASHSAASMPLDDTLNHTLSRRELREMRAAVEAEAPALQQPMSTGLPESIGTLLNSGPIDIPTLAPPPGQSQALAEAMAEFDLLTRSRREAEARARDAQVASLATPVVPQASPSSAPQAPAPQASVPQASVPQASVPEAPVVAQPVVAPIVYPATASLPSPPMAPVVQASAPQVISPPTAPIDENDQHGGRSPRASGHWRVQAAMEDDELPYENTLSRTVGSNTSAITTSALVLPSVPQPDTILNSLTATGEILVTGTIDLPSSLGSTGAHPSRLDNSDFEDDPLDSQIAAPDSAPIRAIRAVSTNTSTRGVIESKRPVGNRALTAVIIIASALCVGIVGLLVYAFASGEL